MLIVNFEYLLLYLSTVNRRADKVYIILYLTVCLFDQLTQPRWPRPRRSEQKSKWIFVSRCWWLFFVSFHNIHLWSDFKKMPKILNFPDVRLVHFNIVFFFHFHIFHMETERKTVRNLCEICENHIKAKM